MLRALRILVFALIELILLPISLIGGIGYMLVIFFVNRPRGISGTAYEPFSGRLLMHDVGTREDVAAKQLSAALPATGPLIWWLIATPTRLAIELSGYMPTMLTYPVTQPDSLMSLITLRTQFLDEALQDSLAQVEQIVVLGAGWDTRVYDLPDGSEHKVFEVDAPTTQKAKRDALARAGIDTSQVTFVAADFNKQSWLDALKDHGFDPDRPTYVHWEGVCMYLEDEAVASTLRSFAELPRGSQIAFDFLAAELLRGEKPFRLLGPYFKLGIKLGYGESLVFGFPMQPSAREALASALAPEGLEIQRFASLGGGNWIVREPIYGFAVVGKVS